jgi:hypothetical protein
MCGHKNFNCEVKVNFRLDCRTITEFWKPTMTLTTEDYETKIFVSLHQCFPTFFHGGIVNNFSHPEEPLPIKTFTAHNRLIAGSLSFTNGEEAV